MRNQKGVTLSGFMLWAIVVVVALLLGFKLGPPYMEYASIQKLIGNIAKDAQAYGENYKSRSVRDFQLKADIDNITSIKGSDLNVRKEGEQVVITVDYRRCEPLVGNVSACMDFNATSRK